MLGLVLALNYVDRSSLATAAPLIQKEFGLTSAELGICHAYDTIFLIVLAVEGKYRFNTGNAPLYNTCGLRLAGFGLKQGGGEPVGGMLDYLAITCIIAESIFELIKSN